MSNGGSGGYKQPPVGLRIGVDPSDKSYVSPMSSSMNVVASKSAPGHVVAGKSAVCLLFCLFFLSTISLFTFFQNNIEKLFELIITMMTNKGSKMRIGLDNVKDSRY